jgi:hypothetical protein
MPHACITTKSGPARAAAAAPDPKDPKDKTHICAAVDSKTAYCGEAVAAADAPELKTCHPDHHGPTCQGCKSECKKKHPHLP